MKHTYSDGAFTWDVKDLWKAAEGIEPVSMPIRYVLNIEQFLDSHSWSAGKMSVREILDHADRIDNADLSYPILLTPDGYVADGCHRIVRALKEGRDSILVIKLPAMPKAKMNNDGCNHFHLEYL